jgi:hypothetical protein
MLSKQQQQQQMRVVPQKRLNDTGTSTSSSRRLGYRFTGGQEITMYMQNQKWTLHPQNSQHAHGTRKNKKGEPKQEHIYGAVTVISCLQLTMHEKVREAKLAVVLLS